MIVYFVRHGESEGNAKNIHQNAETPLSQIGRSQATLAGHRFKTIPIDVILASSMIRTQQTAEIINGALHKQIETTPLLREIHRPSEIVGKNVHDPAVEGVKTLISDHRYEPDWHYSDEENFYDFRLRARTCLRMLGDRKESKILCVTHGIMLVMLMGVIIFEDDLTPDLFQNMLRQFHTQNTGITIVECVNKKWRLETWNDHAHLG